MVGEVVDILHKIFFLLQFFKHISVRFFYSFLDASDHVSGGHIEWKNAISHEREIPRFGSTRYTDSR